MKLNTNKTYWLLFILTCAIAYFSVFHQLGRLTMRVWDEASYALNAQEMLENGNLLVVHEFRKPDLYNTKPPFAIWCMTGCIKLFGFNEFGIRFASACFAFLSVLTCFFAGFRIYKNMVPGFIAALVLCSSNGFMGWHIARTGDTDSILSFWILLSIVTFYLYTETEKSTWLLICTFAVCFACLTKGVSGLVVVPAFFAWIFIVKKQKQLFSDRYFFISVIAFLVIVPGYYLVREMLAPGYLNAVYDNEFGGRFKVQEFINPYGELPFFMYLQNMVSYDRFMPWIILLPFTVISVFVGQPSASKRFGIFCILSSSVMLIILGLSKTKLDWYDAPLYPLFAMIIASAIHTGMASLNKKWSRLLLSGIFILLFISPYQKIVNRNIYEKEDFRFPQFLTKIRSEMKIKDQLYIADRHMMYPINFYIKQDSVEGNKSRMVHPARRDLPENAFIVTLNIPMLNDVQSNYELDTFATYYECGLYKIRKLKQQ